MDKYIFVPQDRYETMVKREKDSISSTSSSLKNVNTPPPGLPATDNRAKQGIIVSDEEAETISKALVDASLDNHKSNQNIEHSQNQNSDWSGFWESQM